jgi:putative membrane protein
MSRGSKVLLGVLGAAVVVSVLLAVFAGSGLFGSSGPMMGRGGGMMDGWGDSFGMVWMVPLMLLVPLLFIGVPIAVVVWAVAQLGSRGGHAASGMDAAGSAGVREQSAEEILRQRFARGEIDAEEYEERRRILGEGSPAAHR